MPFSPALVACLAFPSMGAQEDAADSIRVHPEFELSLVAAEPLVVNPISIGWDARGRLWVATTPGSAHGEILILEDGDGDGRMDTRTVFADGLEHVSSLLLHRDGVLVARSSELLFLRDTDGDERADERTVLFSGPGVDAPHAGVSSLRWGLDGWVYAARSTGGGGLHDVDGADGVEHGPFANGLLRFRPDGTEIEMVSVLGSGASGLDFSWDGELFFSLASGSHLRHVVQAERDLAAGRLEGVESWLDISEHGAGGSLYSGSCLYTGGAWPQEFDGNHFVCAPSAGLVHRDVLAPRGVSFAASRPREEEFMTSSDPCFRPVHLRVGPDGALYVLDLCKPAVDAGDAPPQDRDAGSARSGHGRIWRVQHRTARVQSSPSLAGATDSLLVAALASPNGWRRDTARRLLGEREELSKTTQLALARAAVGAEHPSTRVQALWAVVNGVPALGVEVIQKVLRDPHPSLRRNALQAVWALDDWDVPRVLRRPELLLEEPDARTRLAALTLFRKVLPTRAYEQLGQRLPEYEDGWSRSAVLAVAARRPTQFLSVALTSPPSEALAPILRALAARIARSGDLGAAVELVTAIAERGAAAPRSSSVMLGELARSLDPQLAPWPSPRIDSALLRLLNKRAPAVGIAALPLAVRWSENLKVVAACAALGQGLAEVVQDEALAADARLSALAAMLELDAQRAQAIELAGIFLEPRLALSPAVRRQVLAVFAGCPELATTLLDALEAEQGDE